MAIRLNSSSGAKIAITPGASEKIAMKGGRAVLLTLPQTGGTEPTQLTDYSGYSNTGTYTDITDTQLANGLWTWTFNGTSSTIAISARTWGIANAWSIILWVNPDDITTHMRPLLLNEVASENSIRVIFNQNANGELRLLAYDLSGSGGGTYKDYRANVVTTSWQQLILTWDGTNLLGYRNASPLTFTKPFDFAIVMTDTSRALNLGSAATFFAGAEVFPRIYNYALTSTEVTALYNSQAHLFA